MLPGGSVTAPSVIREFPVCLAPVLPSSPSPQEKYLDGNDAFKDLILDEESINVFKCLG